jgi:hypothetical protein
MADRSCGTRALMPPEKVVVEESGSAEGAEGAVVEAAGV